MRGPMRTHSRMEKPSSHSSEGTRGSGRQWRDIDNESCRTRRWGDGDTIVREEEDGPALEDA